MGATVLGSLSRSTYIVSGLSILSAVIGFSRETYIAYTYGASGTTDAFYIASIIPELLSGLISQCLTNALIPTIAEQERRSHDSAVRLINAVFWSSLLVLLLLAIIAYLLRNQLIRLFAPGLDVSETSTAVYLLSIMAIAVVSSGISGVLWGVHNSYGGFVYPALNGVAYNMSIVLFAVCFHERMGIAALAVGVVFGSLCRMVIQLVPLIRGGILTGPTTLWHPSMRGMITLIIPVFISTGLTSLNLMIDRILASQLPSGEISDFNFASKLGVLPSGLVGAALATTLYPRFVQYSLRLLTDAIRKVLFQAVSLLLFFGCIIGLYYLTLAPSIVAILFHHGLFDVDDVLLTSGPVMIYGCFMPFYLLVPLLTRLLYARKANRFVTVASIASVLSNISFSILLVRSLGLNGLALANGIAQVIFVVVSIVTVQKQLTWRWVSFAKAVIVPAVAPAALFAAALVVVARFYTLDLSQFWSNILRCVASGGLGGGMLVIYFLIRPNNVISALFFGRIKHSLRKQGDK
jgi:putative peptidoglycan lipid II flippase